MFYHKIMGSYDVNEYMYINFVYKWLVTKFMIENQIDYDFFAVNHFLISTKNVNKISINHKYKYVSAKKLHG